MLMTKHSLLIFPKFTIIGEPYFTLCPSKEWLQKLFSYKYIACVSKNPNHIHLVCYSEITHKGISKC